MNTLMDWVFGLTMLLVAILWKSAPFLVGLLVGWLVWGCASVPPQSERPDIFFANKSVYEMVVQDRFKRYVIVGPGTRLCLHPFRTEGEYELRVYGRARGVNREWTVPLDLTWHHWHVEIRGDLKARYRAVEMGMCGT